LGFFIGELDLGRQAAGQEAVTMIPGARRGVKEILRLKTFVFAVIP